MNKFLGLLLLVPTFAFGHGKLLETVPAADSTVNAPKGVILRFNENVRLVKFTVTSESGEELETAFKMPASTYPQYDISVPNIGSGAFTVNWAVIGEDGHTMTDSFTFKVSSVQVTQRSAQRIKREADTFVDAIVL